MQRADENAGAPKRNADLHHPLAGLRHHAGRVARRSRAVDQPVGELLQFGCVHDRSICPSSCGAVKASIRTPRPIFVIASEAKQSMSQRGERWIASSLSLLAMTGNGASPHTPVILREGEDPVRRGLSVLSSASLEYWIVRPSAQSRTRRTMTVRCVSAFSPRIAPEVCWISSPSSNQRAQGMPDARCTRGLMRNVHRKCAHEHTGQRRTSDIPCAMALRLITCSPRRTALLPPLRPGKLLPPGALTPAPRRQDHTSLPYASGAVVTGSIRVHRIPVPRS